MPAGPRKPVERHNGRIYWPTRDVVLGFVDFFHAPGRILGKLFGRPGGFRGVYLRTLFSGCRRRRSLPPRTFPVAVSGAVCILASQTFRVVGILHFTYTNFSGCRQRRNVHFTINFTFCALRAPIQKVQNALQRFAWGGGRAILTNRSN